MTYPKRFIGISIVLAAMVFTAFSVFYVAKANPLFFLVGVQSATATTTLTYMTAGLATTTVLQPSYQNGNSYGMDSGTFLVQLTGSSTATTINVAFEYANSSAGINCQNNPTGCDWYRDTLYGAGSPISTSTTANPTSLNTPTSYTLTFASTTVGGVFGTSSRTTRILNVETPAPYVRAVITMPAGSSPGAVWSEWLPVKQTQ